LLRASGETKNERYDLGLINGAGDGDGLVPHGRLLVAFAEAVLGRDDRALAAARQALVAALGDAALVDAAAVAGLFNAIDRVADATGIPLEPEKAAATADMRAALGIGKYVEARAPLP
jgi:hypothetical protein